jgi:hypothetical protein
MSQLSRLSFRVAVYVASLALACKPKSEPPTPKPAPADSATIDASPAPAASASASAAPSAKAADRRQEKKPAGLSAEQVVEQARARVAEAVSHAGGKDSCSEVLPLLDVSYSIVRTSTPLDEHTLGIFASCALKHHRWRLLRDLAEAIAAGDRKLETTHYLPRAWVGEGSYEVAHTLSKATLRAWPTEGEAYDTAALAALRVKDWDGAVKAADQALLLQRKHGANDEVTSLAHALRGAGLLRMGKTEEGVHEIEAAKTHEGVLKVTDVTLEAAHVVKQKGLLATVDLPDHAYPGLWHLYTRKVAPMSPLVTVTLQDLGDKPIPVVVEIAVEGAETVRQSETVQKGRPITLSVTPELTAGGPLIAPKAPEPREVTVSISGADHGVLYHEASKVTFEPVWSLPKVLRSHGEDLRSAFPLEAAWVTPAAPGITSLVEAAKARLKPAKKFEGAAGASLPQVQALWDELRSRVVSFRREPSLDTETKEETTCALPGETLEAGAGNALESSVLFASLLEAVGLHVVLVRLPGHRMVGWLGTSADVATEGGALQAVKSPLGQAFFLETTTVGDGPFDAAVLRGDAEWVAATNDGSVASGRAEVESLAELRRRGIAARAP